jgi:hypothetical protein
MRPYQRPYKGQGRIKKILLEDFSFSLFFNSLFLLAFFTMSPKGIWTQQDDDKLWKIVKDLQHETGKPDNQAHKVNWKEVAKRMGKTLGACQARWNVHLDPLVDRSPWTPALDAQLLGLYKDKVHNSWSKRAAVLANGKTNEDGLPFRRSGADVCERYFFLVKQGKPSKASEQEENEDEDEDDKVEEPKHAQSRTRNGKRRGQEVVAEEVSSESDKKENNNQVDAPKKKRKESK